jgi:hypothetical protein
MKPKEKKTGRPTGRVINNPSNSAMDPCSWHADYEVYRDSISGLEPTDRCVLDTQSASMTFRGRLVQPVFMDFMEICFPYHLEMRFAGAPTSDGERLEMVQSFVAQMNEKYAQRLKSVKVQDPRGPKSKRQYVMVRAVLLNEFVSFAEEPRLHVLFSLAPTHLVEMLEEFRDELDDFANQRCAECIPFMAVSKVTNQADLVCRLLGIHKDRAFREFPVIV